MVLANAFTVDSVPEAIGDQRWDNCFIMYMYDRLRDLCSALSGRIASHMLTVGGGFPVYEGFCVPETLSPFGMVGPYREDSDT